MLERRPEEVIRLAVKGMMPRNRLARKQLTKLKVYAGPSIRTPHSSRNRWRSLSDRDARGRASHRRRARRSGRARESQPAAEARR